MSGVVTFTGQRGKIFYPERCEIEMNGKKRKRWVVVTREPNGDETYHPVRSEKDAIWLTGILREAETKNRKEDEFLATNPLWQPFRHSLHLSATSRLRQLGNPCHFRRGALISNFWTFTMAATMAAWPCRPTHWRRGFP